MITFLVALVALIGGFFIYGRIVEKFFKPTDNPTPAVTKNDGVDFMSLPTWKVFLIQLLNIAGLGPIFGAISGALWGPCVYIWIVLGTIFAGGVHDYLSGMISLREGGKSLTEIVGKYLGDGILKFMRVFMVLLLLLIGAVFTVGPAGLLRIFTGYSLTTLVIVILIYYFLATLLPIDAIIGKFYPLFGICFIVMAVGIMFGMLFGGTHVMPEIEFANLHPAGLSIWPFMFITVACGAVSGFHATQSPMMARCLKNEHLGRPVFYGAMVCEGIIALIWAAAGITFYESPQNLNELLSSSGAGAVVYQICEGFLGTGLGMSLAMIGVIICPITSGDTTLRSARLILADWFGLSQDKTKMRLVLSVPIILIAGLITQLNFNIIWRYFAWMNQSIATIVLWMGAVYLNQKFEGSSYFIALIPALFMTVVTTTYILIAPEGFQLDATFSTAVGFICMFAFLFQFWKSRRTGIEPRVNLNV